MKKTMLSHLEWEEMCFQRPLKNKVMKANELMIGDWVSLIKGNWSESRQVELTDIEMIAESVYLAESIPLTAEILEKNGFVLDDYYLRYDLYSDNRRVGNRIVEVIPRGGKWSEIGLTIHSGKTDMTSTVEYVHELQHALRLCGIEKEIEL